jgi:hypothetical protein
MIISADQFCDATQNLHHHIHKTHWNGKSIEGPDSGVRWNFKIGRFMKSYLDFLPWKDGYVFFQAQGYWILANWLLANLFGKEDFEKLALNCSQYVTDQQTPEGFWRYPPLPSREGKIATVEGNIAAIALLHSYRQTKLESFLSAAKNWHWFLTHKIGYKEKNGVVAVQYWSDSSSSMVPNNTTLTLWTLAELADVTKDEQYLMPCEKLIAFLRRVQLESGELPYFVDFSLGGGRSHFLCFQYNAFEFIDLYHYYRLTEDQNVRPLMLKLAEFLSEAVSKSGAARYDCFHNTPEVPYYTAAVAAALHKASVLGLGDFHAASERAYARVLSHQKTDGGIRFFSRRNFGFLTDRRSYPRNLSMILYHLLGGISDSWYAEVDQ